MSGSPELFDEDDDPRERPELASTPALELARADGYRWASLDVVDLDPPTRFPPHSAS